jgi:dihydrofolate reductase
MKLLAAVDNNWGIGYKGKLPWHVSEELKHFKEITFGEYCIFGYNTAVTLPTLTGRGIFVITSRYPHGSIVRVGKNIATIIHMNMLENFNFIQNITGIITYVCGGQQLYEHVLEEKLVDECIISRINITSQCDKQFPVKTLDINYSLNNIVSMYDEFSVFSWKVVK